MKLAILISLGILILLILLIIILKKRIEKKQHDATVVLATENKKQEEKPEKEHKSEWEKRIEREIEQGIITEEERELIYDMSPELVATWDYGVIIRKLERNAEYRKSLTKRKDQKQEIEQRNNEFKKFALKKFSKRTFHIQTPQDIKETENTIFANAALLPSFVFSVHRKEETLKLAVECKWLPKLTRSGIIISQKVIFAKNKLFEQNTNIPISIIIGVGGEPTQPEKMFIVPLRDLISNFAPYNILENYEKDPLETFKYDDLNKRVR